MPLARTIASRSVTRSLARRMVGVFAAAGLATTLGWAAAAVPAAQADDSTPVKVTNVVTTSRQAEAWQEIGINADWTADSPKAGQTLTVDLGNGLRWASGVDFKLVKKGDDSVDLGDCTAEINSKHLTCTLNSTVEQWSHIDGTLWARGQITNELIGQKETTINVNGKDFKVVPGDSDGDGVCDTDHCDGVIPEQPLKKTIKTGWLSDLKNGTYTWTWAVNVYGATSYTIVDTDAAFHNVECTDTDWSKTWIPADVKNDEATHTLTWTTSSTETVCRVYYTSTSAVDTAGNTATVNGKNQVAEAKAMTVGSGDGDGFNPTPPATPTPTPEPSVTPEPSSSPSSPSMQEPTPSPTSSKGVPEIHERPTAPPIPDEPAPPAAPVPEDRGPVGPAPENPAPAAPAPENPAPAAPADPAPAGPQEPSASQPAASKTPEAKKPALARTGAAAGVTGLVAVAALAAGGLGLRLARRRA